MSRMSVSRRSSFEGGGGAEGAAACSRFAAFIALITMNNANAMMRKLMMVLISAP
jgi:hypothetical protein